MNSQDNTGINNTEIIKYVKSSSLSPSLPTQLQPLKFTLLYKDVFNQYITKIIELKKYSEDDTLKDISKNINVAYRRVDTKHSTKCIYMFLYEGKSLSNTLPLKKLLSLKYLNFNRDEPIIALQKQPPDIPIDVMTTMLELFGSISGTISDYDNDVNNSEQDSDDDENTSNRDNNNDNNDNDNDGGNIGEHTHETDDLNSENNTDEGGDRYVNTSINGENFQENMITLTNMGFTNEDAMCALVSSGGSLDLAVSLLIPG